MERIVKERERANRQGPASQYSSRRDGLEAAPITEEEIRSGEIRVEGYEDDPAGAVRALRAEGTL
jgi:hypothetical protein